MSDAKNQNQPPAFLQAPASHDASRGCGRKQEGGWHFNRQINVSVLIQLVFLASLIVGIWVNLQRQLDLLQRDVTMLLQSQKDFALKMETLSAKSISYEYRLRALERQISEVDKKNIENN